MTSEYAQDENIREQCRQLMALSLMPISEVEKQFKRIRVLSSPSLDDLFIYFERQWINGNIPLSLWNANESDHRTNNIAEDIRENLYREREINHLLCFLLILAYNRRFTSRAIKKHPNIWTFIGLIQDEHVRFEQIKIQLACGASNSKQSSNKTAFQRRFQTLNMRFKNSEINSKQLLAGLTLLIGGQKK